MASLPTAPLTEEEYLRLDGQSGTKSEFHDGQMFAMAGGSPNHSLLANRAGALLDRQMRSGCRVFNADLRIKIASSKIYVYADASVVCGEPQLAGDQQDSVTNPFLIVEVLSPSTEGYDRGKKFELYRSLESFCEYLLVHQDRRRVEHYSRRDDGSWLFREHSGDQASVAIQSLGIQISLADLYNSSINID